MVGMDDVVKHAQNLADKAQDLAKDNPEKVKQALDKVEDMVDKATSGRFSDQVDKISDTVAERLTDDGPRQS